ncbi:hypothetical protein B0H17DRAFT_718397 [Mycena rosella]|uniref:Uncharacterized protein n=1 Tax=Mycena rosella TaxID=1033263 RepID=A0AAD7GDW0_MYCRO|nr:hypothetical protein B0H17DRAFT_718397 [Mycena rosella]
MRRRGIPSASTNPDPRLHLHLLIKPPSVARLKAPPSPSSKSCARDRLTSTVCDQRYFLLSPPHSLLTARYSPYTRSLARSRLASTSTASCKPRPIRPTRVEHSSGRTASPQKRSATDGAPCSAVYAHSRTTRTLDALRGSMWRNRARLGPRVWNAGHGAIGDDSGARAQRPRRGWGLAQVCCAPSGRFARSAGTGFDGVHTTRVGVGNSTCTHSSLNPCRARTSGILWT